MRAIWSGAISFGLIHIPVRLYNATKEKRLQFHYLRKQDLCPIQYAKICKHSGEEVPYDALVKGYEYEKGDYVILEDKDFQKANPEKYQTINVTSFISEEEINPSYFVKPYYVEPTKEAIKAYVLLREALKKSKKAAVAFFMLRSKEHAAIIRPQDEMLILEQIRFTDEILDPKQLKIPKAEVLKQELSMAMKLIDQLSSAFRPAELMDKYEESLAHVIEQKKIGALERRKVEKVIFPEMPNIMQQLKKSLEQTQKKKQQAYKNVKVKI